MATWLDLGKRLEETLETDERLHTEVTYRGGPLPGWLADPLKGVERNQRDRAGVLVLNVKGRRVEETLCILRLADLERLLKSR